MSTFDLLHHPRSAGSLKMWSSEFPLWSDDPSRPFVWSSEPLRLVLFSPPVPRPTSLSAALSAAKHCVCSSVTADLTSPRTCRQGNGGCEIRDRERERDSCVGGKGAEAGDGEAQAGKALAASRTEAWARAQGKPYGAYGAPLGPLGFNFAQHSPTTRPSVEKTAEKAFLLSDRL
jgi:hypothetical protein